MAGTTRDATTARSRWGRRLLAAAGGSAAAIVAVVWLSGVAAADPPTMPRPTDSCTAKLTIMPNPLLGGRPTEAFATVTGLEPGASFNVFLGTQLTSTGFADLDGAAHVTLLLTPLVSVAIPVQVATTGRCAAETLVVGGKDLINCKAKQISL